MNALASGILLPAPSSQRPRTPQSLHLTLPPVQLRSTPPSSASSSSTVAFAIVVDGGNRRELDPSPIGIVLGRAPADPGAVVRLVRLFGDGTLGTRTAYGPVRSIPLPAPGISIPRSPTEKSCI